MDASRLKIAKRKIRAQRCKATTDQPSKEEVTRLSRDNKNKALASKPKKPQNQSAQSEPLRGDPTLGARLVRLTKEERKEAKRKDATRQARRLDKKKQSRLTMENAMDAGTKDRVRVRKAKGVAVLKAKSRTKSSKA